MADTNLINGKKVLIVDDELDILEALRDLLETCEVVAASTYEEASQLLIKDSFDIAVLDIMGVNGYGLLDIAHRRGIPAVMLTAHAYTADNLVRSIKEGAYAYIPKEELVNIDKHLNDALTAKREGKNPWENWEERLPESYFERKWGAAWKDGNRDFWNNQFKAIVKGRGLKN